MNIQRANYANAVSIQRDRKTAHERTRIAYLTETSAIDQGRAAYRSYNSIEKVRFFRFSLSRYTDNHPRHI